MAPPASRALVRGVAAHFAAVPSLSSHIPRSFCTSAVRAAARAPTIADLELQSAKTFAAKQKEFREKQAAHREKAAKDSRQAARTAEKTSQATATDESSKKRGTLSSIIYGTPEGRQHEQEIERSYSQTLARGKYVHSITFHEVKPGHVDEYVELIGSMYPAIANEPKNNLHLVGSWRTDVGDVDTFVHIWEYYGYQGYHESLHEIKHSPNYPAYEKKLASLINSKRTSLMQEFSFWPTTSPRQLGGIFELRSYHLHPGNLLEWETHWRKGLEARREVMEGVGAWFVQVGELNTVHHLWQFANLEDRKTQRENCWAVPGWSDTVHKTVPLIQTMTSRILMPMPWSPIG